MFNYAEKIKYPHRKGCFLHIWSFKAVINEQAKQEQRDSSAGASFKYGQVDIFVQAKVAEIKPK